MSANDYFFDLGEWTLPYHHRRNYYSRYILSVIARGSLNSSEIFRRDKEICGR